MYTGFSYQSEKEISHEPAAKNAWLSCLYCTYPKLPNSAKLQHTTSQHTTVLSLQLPLTGKLAKKLEDR